MYKKRPQRYKSKRKSQTGGQEVVRVKLPKENQVFGRIESLLGGKRMRVKCSDAKIRICRVPGRVRLPRLREDDYVLVEPWEVGGETRGDVILKYSPTEVNWLMKKGYLEEL